MYRLILTPKIPNFLHTAVFRFLVSLNCLSSGPHSVSCDVGATSIHLVHIVGFIARIFQSINSRRMCTMKTLSRIFRQLYLLRVTLCYTLRRVVLGSTDSVSILSDSVTRNVAIDWLTHRLRIRGGLCFEFHLENELLLALFSLVN